MEFSVDLDQTPVDLERRAMTWNLDENPHTSYFYRLGLIGGSAVGFYRFSFLNLNKLAPLQYFSFRFALNDKKFCSKQISSDR